MYQATRAGVNQWFFPVPFSAMCAAPTVTFYNPVSANAKWYNASNGADSGDPASYYSANQQVILSNTQVSGDAIINLIFIHATFDARLI